MPGLDFLDLKHVLYGSHEVAWKREERRHAGGDAVLSELVQFSYEETTSYTDRQAWARWTNFARLHTTVLAGHLRRAAPLPEMGQLGEIRSRSESQGAPTLAELFYYNCDGVGSDGSQLPAFMDGVEQRALATGFRWLMVEMPTRQTLDAIRGTDSTGPIRTTDADAKAGFRPFLVEYSPLSVTNWRYRDGVLCWAVIRLAVEQEKDFEETALAGDGYYLLVRKGYEGLGEDYATGGWWKYGPDKSLLDEGTWEDTDGQIPMWQHLGEPGNGTWERPSIGQSSTMELGQISADLMNAISEQRYNARQAAKSITYFLGINAEEHAKVIAQQTAGSITVGVPPVMGPDGAVLVPTVYNSSEGALATEVYRTLVEMAMAEAKEVMVRQITAGANASGERVEADHAQHTAPMLSRIAATAEQSWNTMLYFVAKRFGILRPTASITLPREYQLRDVREDIESMLKTVLETGTRSPTWERALVQRKGDELDLIPEEEREAIEAELEEGSDVSARLAILKAKAEAMEALVRAGASDEAAAEMAGFTPEEARKLFGDASGQEDAEVTDANGRPLRMPGRAVA
jgi:hypothetical protein